MKLAFCIFKYFPFGGVQRDFLRLAALCANKGHDVHVFTLSWQGDMPDNIQVEIIPTSGFLNHTRYRQFIDIVTQRLQTITFDGVIGFNKMPGLDIYYAADPCYAAKIKQRYGFWYQYLPRYRQLKAFEAAVFDKHARTHILLLTDQQRPDFQQYYTTPATRFTVLPPAIDKNRMAPANAMEIRQQFRQTWQLRDDDKLLLAVGSGFKTKGLDRSLQAIASLPASVKTKTKFMVLGQDNAQPFIRLAQKLNISERVHFLGGRGDILPFFLGADLLLHPAYAENTGTVLLEAVVAGLPVLTTAVCGYAGYVADAKAGIVLPSPFSQTQMNTVLLDLLTSTTTQAMSQAGRTYGKTAPWYDGATVALNCIEHSLREKKR